MTPTPQAPQGPFSTTPVDHGELTRALHSAYDGIHAEPGLMQTVGFAIEQFFANLASAAYRALVESSGPGRVVIWILLALGGVVLLWTVAWLLRRIGVVGEHSLGATIGDVDSVDWQKEADKALSVGDPQKATRALYRHLVITLTKKGWLSDRPGVTSGDCRRAVRELPNLYSAVDPATRAFERVTYGKRPVHQGDIEMMRLASRLALEAPRRSEGSGTN